MGIICPSHGLLSCYRPVCSQPFGAAELAAVTGSRGGGRGLEQLVLFHQSSLSLLLAFIQHFLFDRWFSPWFHGPLPRLCPVHPSVRIDFPYADSSALHPFTPHASTPPLALLPLCLSDHNSILIRTQVWNGVSGGGGGSPMSHIEPGTTHTRTFTHVPSSRPLPTVDDDIGKQKMNGRVVPSHTHVAPIKLSSLTIRLIGWRCFRADGRSLV
jgi:hypothetical protein